MRVHKGLISAMAACLAITWCNGVPAQEPATTAASQPQQESKILVGKTFRVSKLDGLNVRNMEGEKLGTVKDLAVNVQTGKVEYLALSVGGVLGVGDKLYAVPFNELKFNHGQDEMFFVLNMSKEKLNAAPGFDSHDWPNFADPNWRQKIDNYYRQAQTERDRNASETRTKSEK